MNLSIQLNEEAADAVAKRTASHNANLEEGAPQLTNEQYCERVLAVAVESWVAEDYKAAVKRLGDAAAKLPYADRKALIAQVEAVTQ